MNRQAYRRATFLMAFAAVNESNLKYETDKFGRKTGRVYGMPRKERRNLARAYAAARRLS